jgi:hypothetical protein
MFAFWMCAPIRRNAWYTGISCATDRHSGDEEIPQRHVALLLKHRMSVLSSGACRVLKLQEIYDQLLRPVNYVFAESVQGLTNPSALCPSDTPKE